VLADVTTKTIRPLTNTGGWVVSGDYVDDSVISPDGRQVAYSWFIEDEGRYELRVVSTATANARPRTIMRPPKGEWVGPAAWTPDATRLVVAREADRIWQLGIAAVSDGSYTSLKSLEWRNPGLVSMSPDGRHIAYTAQFPDNGSPRDIFVLALDGSQETAVVSGPADDFNPLCRQMPRTSCSSATAQGATVSGECRCATAGPRAGSAAESRRGFDESVGNYTERFSLLRRPRQYATGCLCGALRGQQDHKDSDPRERSIR
jgi:Tol biopolymer transport system component